MADFAIKDGCGSGARVKVCEQNRLQTDAIIMASVHSSSKKGYAYMFNTEDTAPTLTVTTTGGYIAYLKNESEYEMHLHKIITTVDGAASLSIMRNPDLGTIGNENTHAPVNLNFSSSKTAEVVAYVWDEVGNGMTGITDGTTLRTTTIGAAGIVIMELSDALILPRGARVGFVGKGIGGSREMGFSLLFYFHMAR